MRTSIANGCYRSVNRLLRAAIPAALVVGLSVHPQSHARAAGVVTVNQPWVRPASARATTPAYLVLGSSEAAALVGARSPLGEVVLMRGRAAVEEIPIPAGTPIAMTPQGPHLAIRKVAQPLATGARVPLTLVLRDAAGATRDVDVSAEVRLRSPVDDERREHGHPHAHR